MIRFTKSMGNESEGFELKPTCPHCGKECVEEIFSAAKHGALTILCLECGRYFSMEYKAEISFEVTAPENDHDSQILEMGDKVLRGELDIADVPESIRTSNRRFYPFAFRRLYGFLESGGQLEDLSAKINMRVDPFLLARHDYHLATDERIKRWLKGQIEGNDFLEEKAGCRGEYERMDKYEIIAKAEIGIRTRE